MVVALPVVRLRRAFLPPTMFLLVLLPVVDTAAQGTRADYERAEKLQSLTRGKVFKSAVEPHWFADNSRFWYRNDLIEGRREFIAVDAVKGERKAAFDHARLAEALAKAIGKPVDAARLPLDRIELADSAAAVRFETAGKTWKCDLVSYEITADEGKVRGDASDERSIRPRRCRWSTL